MKKFKKKISPGKKIYFASDFHLGVPTKAESLQREKKIISWLDTIKKDAQEIYLVGDIFDFWFEYKHVIPKGYIRFLGKLSELKDEGIAIYFFHGNHDMWMFDYFPSELNIPVYSSEIQLDFGHRKIFVGHGDGLGPGDYTYKFLKKVFRNPIAQFLFKWLHPNIGMALANFWSSKSRLSNLKKEDEFKGDDEWLLQYCTEVEKKEHHDYYIFGHRHLKLELPVAENSTYFNLGEWVMESNYAVFDGTEVKLKSYEG